MCRGEGDIWWGTCKGDALPMGWTRLLRLSVICIRSVHVIRVHMWRIPYALETNVHCVVGRDDGSVCLLISTSHCYYPMGEAFKIRHHDQDMVRFCVQVGALFCLQEAMLCLLLWVLGATLWLWLLCNHFLCTQTRQTFFLGSKLDPCKTMYITLTLGEEMIDERFPDQITKCLSFTYSIHFICNVK